MTTLPTPLVYRQLFGKREDRLPLPEARKVARAVACDLLETTELRRDPVPMTLLTPAAWEVRDGADAEGTATRDRFIVTTTSSTDRDLYNTRMSRTALQKMKQSALERMTIFLNHVYTVPESVLGTVADAVLVERTDPKTGDRYLDLDISVKVLPEGVNERADKAWAQLLAGTKLGFSIGALILDWEIQTKDGTPVDEDEDDADPYEVLYGENPKDYYFTITDVLLVESSLVGVPANRRSWVAETRKTLMKAGELPQPAGLPPTRSMTPVVDNTPAVEAAVPYTSLEAPADDAVAPEETPVPQPAAPAPQRAAPAPAVRAEQSTRLHDDEGATLGLKIEQDADPAGVDDLEAALLATYRAAGPTAASASPAQTFLGRPVTPAPLGVAGAPASSAVTWNAVVERHADESVAAHVARGGTVYSLAEDEEGDEKEERSIAELETLAYGLQPPAAARAAAPPADEPAATLPEGLVLAADEPSASEQRIVGILSTRLEAICAHLEDMVARGLSHEQTSALTMAHNHAAHTLGMQCCGLEGCAGHPAAHDMSRRGLGEAAVHLTRSHDHLAKTLGLDCMAFGDQPDDNDADDAPPPGKSAAKKDAGLAVIARLATPLGELTLSGPAEAAGVLVDYLRTNGVDLALPFPGELRAGASPADAGGGLHPDEMRELRLLTQRAEAALRTLGSQQTAAVALHRTIVEDIRKLGVRERELLELVRDARDFIRISDDHGLYRPTNRQAISADEAHSTTRRLAAQGLIPGAGTGYLAADMATLDQRVRRHTRTLSSDPAETTADPSLIAMSDEDFYRLYGVQDPSV